MDATLTVRGTIRLPPDGLPARAATVVVQVEDVSRADAPSTVVGETRLADVTLSPGGTLDFEVDVPTDRVDPRSSYSVRVHFDVGGTGAVDLGDLVTVRSYPVLTRGHGREAEIEVRRV